MDTPDRDMPEIKVYPKNMGKGSSFKDFSPKVVGRVMPYEYGEEAQTQPEPEVESADPKASDAQECADSSGSDSSGNLKTEETSLETQQPKLPPSIPTPPSIPPASAAKVASSPAS